MAEFQFLDKIINTVSLQVRPNNTYKAKTCNYLPSSTTSHVKNYVSSSSSYQSASAYDNLFDSSIFYVDQTFTPANISVPQNYFYFSYSATIFIADGFSTQEEYDFIGTINSQLQYNEDSFPTNTFYNSYDFVVSQENSSTSFSSNSSSISFSSSSDSLVSSQPSSYSNYEKAETVLNTFLIDAPLYIQNKEDDLNLALDLSSNTIIEEELVVASTYTPPDPSDITIISLKEFWA